MTAAQIDDLEKLKAPQHEDHEDHGGGESDETTHVETQ